MPTEAPPQPQIQRPATQETQASRNLNVLHDIQSESPGPALTLDKLFSDPNIIAATKGFSRQIGESHQKGDLVHQQENLTDQAFQEPFFTEGAVFNRPPFNPRRPQNGPIPQASKGFMERRQREADKKTQDKRYPISPLGALVPHIGRLHEPRPKPQASPNNAPYDPTEWSGEWTRVGETPPPTYAPQSADSIIDSRMPNRIQGSGQPVPESGPVAQAVDAESNPAEGAEQTETSPQETAPEAPIEENFDQLQLNLINAEDSLQIAQERGLPPEIVRQFTDDLNRAQSAYFDALYGPENSSWLSSLATTEAPSASPLSSAESTEPIAQETTRLEENARLKDAVVQMAQLALKETTTTEAAAEIGRILESVSQEFSTSNPLPTNGNT